MPIGCDSQIPTLALWLFGVVGRQINADSAEKSQEVKQQQHFLLYILFTYFGRKFGPEKNGKKNRIKQSWLELQSGLTTFVCMKISLNRNVIELEFRSFISTLNFKTPAFFVVVGGGILKLKEVLLFCSCASEHFYDFVFGICQ